MRLWTIQPVEVYDILLRDGAYSPDPSLIVNPEFIPSYDWICKHLESKSPKPDNVHYPVWAWHTLEGKRKKPDLRRNYYGKRGEKLVLLELEIPNEDDILLSDFSLWHFVLNNWWLNPHMFEDDYNYEEDEKWDRWYCGLSSEEQRKVKEESWEQIFDVTPFENEWIKKGYDIQGIFWELKKEYVKKVQYFTAR